ncbi:lactonase family protein [Caldimonas tepidiphila]|uniref:lactonase family protein n=1 Tax=Caldimonas tepidiphila TaxID=2315841 RepID=UPI000E5B7D1C|nr:beta-propeller fold lactonase family protein [Caldimonas tepidiphila]
MYAYVGSRTTRERNARGEGLSVFKVGTDGALTLVQLVGDLVNPSYLALSRDGECLYTVHGDQSEVSAFAVDRRTGQLSFLNRQSTEGRNPVHLALDASGRFLVVTNHLGASLAVLPIAADGSLEPISQLERIDGPIGPHRLEQKQPKPHYNAFDPSGRFVLVPDKGCDRVFGFRFEAGRLAPAEPSFVACREGAGPRHLAFHPRQPWAYVVNELDSTVTACRFDAECGALAPFQVLSALPDDFTGNSRAAAIAVDAAGRTLYASNRGHDSIAVFRIDPATGRLGFAAAVPSGGRTPRAFSLSPDGRRLYALNEDSDTIVTFAVDALSGHLAPTGQIAHSGSPVCMVFSPA